MRKDISYHCRGMKSYRELAMSGGGQEIGIDLDPPLMNQNLPHNSGGVRMTHSRSASWSFTRGQRPGGSDLSSSLAALNPLTSVIREIVGHDSENSSPSSPRMSRAASQVSLPLSRGPSYDDELSNGPPRSPQGMEERPRPHPHPHLNVNTEEQNNIGFEISDGIRWLEHNAIFIILLLIKFAWYHRSGESANFV